MAPPAAAPLRPVRRPPGRRRSFLRTARLNTVGWSALGGACLLAATGSALALRRSPVPWPWAALPGPVVVLAGVVAADRRAWAGRETGFGFTDDLAELHAVAARLTARGVAVRVTERPPRLRYPNRYAGRVQAALVELGLPVPPW